MTTTFGVVSCTMIGDARHALQPYGRDCCGGAPDGLSVSVPDPGGGVPEGLRVRVPLLDGGGVPDGLREKLELAEPVNGAIPLGFAAVGDPLGRMEKLDEFFEVDGLIALGREALLEPLGRVEKLLLLRLDDEEAPPPRPAA